MGLPGILQFHSYFRSEAFTYDGFVGNEDGFQSMLTSKSNTESSTGCYCVLGGIINVTVIPLYSCLN